MQELVENTEAVRALLDRYIRTMFKPGLHYGLIPVDGQTSSKPTLLKAGAELIALLFGWRARFTADKDTVEMYGQAPRARLPTSASSSTARGRWSGRGAASPSCARPA
jgi:hypothetical protein